MSGKSFAKNGAIQDRCQIQCGAISRKQLNRLGLSPGGIDGRVKRAMLFRIYEGTFSTSRRISLETVWMAGVLKAGDGSALSHMSAARHWRLTNASGPTEVLRTTGSGRNLRSAKRGRSGMDSQASLEGYANLPILKIHRTRSLHRSEVTLHKGIPVTTVARLFVDICDSIGEGQLRSLLHEASRIGLLKFDEMRATLDRARGRKGVKRLRGIIDEWDPQTALTRNQFEKRVRDLLRRGNLPNPLLNRIVGGYEVDFFFEDYGLILEVDGAQDHNAPHGVERDKDKDSELHLKGFRVLRLTWAMIMRDPEGSMEKVRAHLALCRSEGRRADPGWGSASIGKW